MWMSAKSGDSGIPTGREKGANRSRFALHISCQNTFVVTWKNQGVTFLNVSFKFRIIFLPVENVGNF